MTSIVPYNYTALRDMASMIYALRQAVPGLTRQLLHCSHRPSSALPKSVSSNRPHRTSEALPRLIRSFKTSPRCTSQAVANTYSSRSQPKSYVSFLKSKAKKIAGRGGGTAHAGFFPRTSEKVVAYWLLGSAASVFGIVVFGGLTRLTESGYGLFELPVPIC